MSSANRIRVMVVDDHPIMRKGLRDTLEASGRFEVVGEARNGEVAVRTVEGLRPEVIVHGCDDAGKRTASMPARRSWNFCPTRGC